MFFELHEERKIGYKLLSDADLGTGHTSHQTHIGLAANVLTFLSDRDDVSEDSIFIYENSFDYLDAHFDRIERNYGEFNAPKIKTGGRESISVTSVIRDIVKKNGIELKWFLFWFGLKNEKAVFLLFNQNSNDFKEILSLGLNLVNITRGAKIVEDSLTNSIASFIEKRVNENGLPTIKKLEEDAQIGLIQPSKEIGSYDIERANEIFKALGRRGEELIAKHFEIQKQKKLIDHYEWYNKERESGKPYDFHYETKNANTIYLDVKTTKFEFNRKIIFSSQELEHIARHDTSYAIYRVYFNNDNVPHVRICDNCKDFATRVSLLTNEYLKGLLPLHTDFRGAKLALSPENELLSFKQAVRL
jgi:hypothetical protein